MGKRRLALNRGPDIESGIQDRPNAIYRVDLEGHHEVVELCIHVLAKMWRALEDIKGCKGSKDSTAQAASRFLQHPPLERPQHRVRAVPRSQLGEDVRDVDLHRALG